MPFVRLVDYICSQVLIARVIENTAELLVQLRAPRAADAEKLPKPTFVALVDFEDVGMSFVPSEEAVADTLRNSVIDGAPWTARVWSPGCLHYVRQTTSGAAQPADKKLLDSGALFPRSLGIICAVWSMSSVVLGHPYAHVGRSVCWSWRRRCVAVHSQVLAESCTSACHSMAQ